MAGKTKISAGVVVRERHPHGQKRIPVGSRGISLVYVRLECSIAEQLSCHIRLVQKPVELDPCDVHLLL